MTYLQQSVSLCCRHRNWETKDKLQCLQSSMTFVSMKQPSFIVYYFNILKCMSKANMVQSTLMIDNRMMFLYTSRDVRIRRSISESWSNLYRTYDTNASFNQMLAGRHILSSKYCRSHDRISIKKEGVVFNEIQQ